MTDQEIIEAITDEEFDRELTAIVAEETAGALLQIPGVYEVLSEHFNNEVLQGIVDAKRMDMEMDEDD